MIGYDIIGDIHGYGEELVELLSHLGYGNSDSGYCHPDRKAIFLGDFIDRGRNHRLVLDTVMSMIENGHAMAVMGNHEFNALAYHTLYNGEYLRPHTPKNTGQHTAFLDEFDGDVEYKRRVLDFFKTLPLWLEVDGIRIVHACWDDDSIELLDNELNDCRLSSKTLIEACRHGSPLFNAIETVLKGVEIKLPGDITFEDFDGYPRDTIRIEWWKPGARTIGEVAIVKNRNELSEFENKPLPDSISFYGPENPLCFIGHYWRRGEPKALASNVACVDYSVAKNGKLVAYRWDGERTLAMNKFHYVT